MDEEKYPFLVLADNWLWSMSDRAISAHFRGDDELALHDLRRLEFTRKWADDTASQIHGPIPKQDGDR